MDCKSHGSWLHEVNDDSLTGCYDSGSTIRITDHELGDLWSGTVAPQHRPMDSWSCLLAMIDRGKTSTRSGLHSAGADERSVLKV
jgi:hypothetical protein